MKNQSLFSLTDKSKKLKCRLLQYLFGALRVKDYLPIKKGAKINMTVYPLILIFVHVLQCHFSVWYEAS